MKLNGLKTIIYAAALLTCAAVTCGPPDPDVACAWEFRAAIPSGYSGGYGVAVNGADVYVTSVKENNNRLVILKFDGSKFTEDYVAPYENFEEADFRDIAFAAGVGWAVGAKMNPDAPPFYLPYIVRYSGSGWHDLDINDDSLGGFAAVSPVDGDECWLVGTISAGSPFGPNGVLVKYKAGDFKRYRELGTVWGPVYGATSRRVYAVDSATAQDYHTLLVSEDDGATWTRENISFYDLDYELQFLMAGDDNGDDFYLIGNFIGEAWGLVKRSGPVGDGLYELSFLEAVDPVFGDIHNVCFDDSGRGVAVGKNAALFYDGRSWTREELPGSLDFRDVAAAPEGGFWALAYTLDGFDWGSGALYYHP